ncbi:MAG TPA: redoxin domain-containing protein [Polyangiaceae bacterium]|nr:redoxin domain-containing protein [Polyangiaceae bacterium]
MERERPSSRALAPGQDAPDFTLRSTPDQTVSLSDFTDHPVVLVFYPADWSPVCGDEVTLFNELLPEFRRLDANVLGISVDSAWSHVAFARERKLSFPLLADFEPKGEVARAYGVYRSSEGVSERALFVIDGGRTIRYGYVSPIGVNPGAEGVLSVLETLHEEAGPKEKSSDRNVRQPPTDGPSQRL